MNSLTHCSVPGCSLDPEKGSTVPYPFPDIDITHRSSWLEFCRLKEEDLCDANFICSRHFTEDSYEPSLDRDSNVWRLVANAVPSLFPPLPSDEPVITSGTIKNEVIPIDTLELNLEHLGTDHLGTEEATNSSTNKCRLCLSNVDFENGAAISLFTSQEGNSSLSEQLFSWFQLELEDSPDWPSFICVACYGTISQIAHFKNTIVSSHCSLHEMIVAHEDTNLEELKQEDDQEDHESLTADEDMSDAPLVEKKRGPKTLKRIPRSSEKNSELETLLVSLQVLKCSVCQSDLSCFPSLDTHMKLEHSKATGYIVCCGEKVRGLTNIMDHMEYHQDQDKFKCIDCELRCTTYDNLVQHRYYAHPNNRFQCEACGKISKGHGGYMMHLATHLPKDKRPYKCPHCPIAFCNSGNLTRHIQRKHDIKERHVCDVCGKGFSNYSSFYMHKESTHEGGLFKKVSKNQPRGMKRPCTVCGSMTTNMILHMKDKHSDREFVPDNYDREPIPCEECGVVVPRFRMHRHIWTAHKRKPFTCEICKIEFRSYSTYQRHMDKHLDRKYPCPHCDVLKDTDGARYFHIRTYHPEEWAKIARRKVLVKEDE